MINIATVILKQKLNKINMHIYRNTVKMFWKDSKVLMHNYDFNQHKRNVMQSTTHFKTLASGQYS